MRAGESAPADRPCGVPFLWARVVDDVITTGSTADALAHVLKQAGAAEVSLYALARA